MADGTQLLPLDAVTHRVFMLLDSDLAALYGVATRRLNEQVRRNRERSPRDFIFELTAEKFANLKSQTATSSWGGRRKLPLAFTKHSQSWRRRCSTARTSSSSRDSMRCANR